MHYTWLKKRITRTFAFFNLNVIFASSKHISSDIIILFDRMNGYWKQFTRFLIFVKAWYTRDYQNEQQNPQGI